MSPRDDSRSAHTPRASNQTPVRRWHRLLTGLILSTLLVLGSRAFFPTFAAVTAPYVPVQWEATVGTNLLSFLAPPNTVCMETSGQTALDRLARRLVPAHAHLDSRYRILVVDRPLINALSLPGGTILLYRGLLDHIRTPAQLAGVLAHEFAHLEAQHPTRILVERTVETTVLSSLGSGGYSALASHPASVGFASLLEHTDQFERDADRAAVGSLLDAGIAPEEFLDLLRVLKPLDQRGPSTDPSNLESRIQALESFLSARLITRVPARPAAGQPPRPGIDWAVLSDTEWRAVQRLCRVGQRAATG